MYLISRARVALNAAALPFLTFPKPFAFTGPHAALALCRQIAATGIKRLLVVTDGPLLRLGLPAPLIEALEGAGLQVEVFSEVEPDPGYDVILAGVARLRESRAEAVLAVGGGSSIDCAKAMLLSHANNVHPSRLKGVWLYALPRRKGLPFYAIPTTAGTGSEVTIVSVVSDKVAKVKYAILDPKQVPAMVALDPTLMAGLPPQITAPTGMDALTHAVEAYLSTTVSEETDDLARSATASIVRSLPVAYADGQDLEAREQMAIASSLAGLAFTRAGVGYVHAFAHQLGALYHVPHGLANAIVMPYVLDFSKATCAPRLADLARSAGLGAPGASEAELADAFIAHVRAMNQAMRIPDKIQELRREDYGTIIAHAFHEAHGTYAVPRYMVRGDAVALLDELMPH